MYMYFKKVIIREVNELKICCTNHREGCGWEGCGWEGCGWEGCGWGMYSYMYVKVVTDVYFSKPLRLFSKY